MIFTFGIIVCFLSATRGELCQDNSWIALTVCSNNYNNVTQRYPDNYNVLCQAAVQYLKCMQSNYGCVLELKLGQIMEITKAAVAKDCGSSDTPGIATFGHSTISPMLYAFTAYLVTTTLHT